MILQLSKKTRDNSEGRKLEMNMYKGDFGEQSEGEAWERRFTEEREVWLKHLSGCVKPGKIVELGCGGGFVLDTVSVDFADSIIVGVDAAMGELEKLVEKDLKNVIPVKADITQNIFPDRTFDTALFVATLHEIFSDLGREKVEDAFRVAHDVLKDNGVLIIQDFLKPSPRLVEITFKNEETRRKFLRFADEFRPRKVKFEETRGRVKLDIADANEFISKYYFGYSEERWKRHMSHTHLFFTEEEYKEIARRIGFIIKGSMKLPTGENLWAEIRKDIEFDFETEYGWIQLVLIKKQH
jgi:SAM-dependent methyltransferase